MCVLIDDRLIQTNYRWCLASPCSSVHQLHSWETESASWTRWLPAWPASEHQCCALQTRSNQQTAGTKAHKNEYVFICSCVTHCIVCLPTLDLYQSSDSCMFFRAMVSYWALMSLRAPVRSGLELLSTSIFSCWVWTLTCTSWISW